VGAQREEALVAGTHVRTRPGFAPRIVIAEHSLEGVYVVPPARSLEPNLGPTLASRRHARRNVWIAVGGAEIDTARSAPPAFAACEGCEIARRDLPIAAQRQPVRAGRELDVPRTPATVRRLEHPGLVGVRDEEAVVIAAAAGLERGASLAVPLDQCSDDLERFSRVAAPLEAEPDQIHADQSGSLFEALLAEDGVVAQRHAVLVDTMLEAPDPPRRVPHHPVGLGHLRDFDVSTAGSGAGRVVGRLVLHEGLALLPLAIAVLREEGGAQRGFGAQGHDRVAHGRPPYQAPLRGASRRCSEGATPQGSRRQH
jgi:hypothetical protein